MQTACSRRITALGAVVMHATMGASLVGIASRVHAQATVSSATVHVGGYYNSNTRLTVDQPVADSSGSADATWVVERRDERLTWSVSPRINHQQYDAQAVLNRTDKFLSLQSRWTAERASIDGAARYVRDSTLTSELGSSGISEVDRDHSLFSVNAGPTIEISERGAVRLDGAWSRNRYERPVGTGLTDYDYASISVANTYQADQATQLSLSFSSGELRVPSSNTATENLSAQIRISSAVGERLRTTLAGGPSRVETEADVDNGFNYRAEMEWQGERASLSAVAGRDVIPTGRGNLSKRVHASIGARYSLSEQSVASLRGEWANNRDVATLRTASASEVRYSRVNATVRWRVLAEWSLWTSADWTRQANGSLSNAASGWRGGVGLSWQSREHCW